MADEEIAIVGAGCRFPGADNLDEYWRVLVNGENHVRDIPESRWKNSAFYNEDPNVPGKSYVKKAGLLKDHDRFDYRLFGISEVEATRMDPQQRYVLECVHMAMEDGGFTRKQLNGTNTGVIIGCMNDDYGAMANFDLADVGGYNATGTSVSVISARVSYVYNLHGTCLTLDTACSSALVAIHLASQAIRTGDCDMMICGGVNSILSPDIYIALCKARMMSATGQCQSFCETADGYARGEGCGIVILKSLKAARRDGNKIWGTIKTGSNQDGCIAKPITAPSGEQQMKLLQHVYKKFKFDPSDVQYIEAHGTGTPRGDPTELNALGEFFAESRDDKARLLGVGSVKSNIGHTESAAGIAGLLKILLMMNHGQYVPSLHVNPDKSNVNSKIKLAEYRLDIVTSVEEWRWNKDKQRHACLNSFGFGGSNTHAIITQTEDFVSKPTSSAENHEHIPICVSGVDPESLKLNLLQLYEDLDDINVNNPNIGAISLKNRDIFPYRTLVFGKDAADLKKACESKANKAAEVSPKKKHNKVFVYCGVGTTWTGMCQEMMQQFKVFRDKVHEIDEYLEPLAEWKIADKFTTETNYDDPFLNHIAIFCVQVALTAVWRSYGIVPDKIIGQSVGEVAAAHVAGCLSLEEAVNVIYYRSLILSYQSQGSMAVVGNIDIEEVEKLCNKFDNKVCIAVYSSPTACTLSGSKDDLRLFTENLKNEESHRDLFIRELKVKCAYHSHFLEGCMDEIRTKIDNTLRSIKSTTEKPSESAVLISTVTGEKAVPADMPTGDYWATNIRQPVKFMQSIKHAFEEDMYNVYLEIGPRPVLKAHLANIFNDTEQVESFPSMVVKKERECLHSTLSNLFESGLEINPYWLDNISTVEMSRIPRYVFNKTGILFIPEKCTEYMAGSSASSATHLYVQTSRGQQETSFKILLNEESTPFVFEHFLSDNIIVPGATYVEAGFHVGYELFKVPVNRISVGFNFMKTFTPTKGRQSEIQADVQFQDGMIKLALKGNDNNLANGTITRRRNAEKYDIDIDYLRALCKHHRSKKQCYDALEQFNFKYGESLSLIQQAWISDSGTECLVEIQIPESVNNDLTQTHFHPSVIDCLFQMFGIIVGESLKDAFAVPKGVDSVVMNRALITNMYGCAEEVTKTDNATNYNAILMTPDGVVIAEIENFFTRIITKDLASVDNSSEYTLDWSEQEMITENPPEHNRILVLSDQPDKQWIHELQRTTNLKITGLNNEWLQEEERGSTKVIYHVPCGIGKTNLKSVFDDTLNRFLYVQNLLVTKNQTVEAAQIIIVTENTQACPERKHIDFTGSELWGMIRSAMHEGYFGKVRLIDIDPNNFDVNAFLGVITSEDHHNFEHAIYGPKVYKARLSHGRSLGNPNRKISVKSSDVLSVHSTSSKCVLNPYLLASVSDKPQSGSVTVALESFTVHEKSLYISVVGDAIKSDRILQNDQDSQILVLEGKGRSLDSEAEVVFLYPVKAVTTVNIPRQCIFLSDECSFYQSGILILLNALVHIVSSIESGQDIAVLKASANTDIGEDLFRYMIKKKKCNIRFYTRKDLEKDTTPFDEKTVVLAMVSSVRTWNLAVQRFPNMKKVVTLRNLIPDNLLLWIKHTYLDVTVEAISMMEIMSGRKITDAVPMVRSCMREYSSDYKTAQGNEFLFKLPMQSFELKNEIESGSLKCIINAASLFRSNASYIIIGGLTGLGWELLQQMAALGAKVLITMSRRAPSEIMQDSIKYVEDEYGCRIVPLQVDICNLESIEKAFNSIDAMFPNHPIKGIFHGAGVIVDSILQSLDEEMIVKVMKPKISGVWNLHVASLNLALDYFVIHSSIVSVLGNPGQCNYSAANSFLDSFALYRRSLGLPAQSINWGALEVGMAAETDELKSKLKEKGFSLLGKERLKEYFIRALEKNATNVVYADIEWEKLLAGPTFAMQGEKFDEFYKVKTSSKMPNSDKKIRIDFDELNSLDDATKEERVKSVLKEIIQLVLVSETGALTDDTHLTEIGIDSMAAMSLSNAIDETFGFREPVVVLLSEDTDVTTISDHILESYRQTKEGDIVSTDLSEASSEFDYLFESNDITFMQKWILESYQAHGSDPFYLTVIEIEVPGVTLPLSYWKKILNHTIKLNPEFQKRYFFSQNGDISVENISDEESPLKITEISREEFEEGQTYDVRHTIDFDIHNSLPISVQVAQSEDKKMCRLIMHKVAFDMKCFRIFCMDLESSFKSIVNDESLPETRPYIDVPSAVRNAIHPKMKSMQAYWKNHLNCDIKPITLGPSLRTPDGEFCEEVDLNFTPSVVVKLRKFMAKQGATLYEFVMSLYQLYLYIGSGSTLVTAATTADLRYHVPELNNVLTRCVNYIPAIAKIEESESVAEFVKRNSKQLSKTTENGAYPSSLINQYIESAEMRANMTRHVLSMNDLTGMREVTETKNIFNIRRILHSNPTLETFINVQMDMRSDWIKLELGYNDDICADVGRSFSRIMETLAIMAIDASQTSLGETRAKLLAGNYNIHVKTPDIPKDVSLPNNQYSERPDTNKYNESANYDIQPVIKAIETQLIMNGQERKHKESDKKNDGKIKNGKKKEKEIIPKIKDVLIKGQFSKQTSYGWDHKVEASLVVDDEDRVMLEWGKDRRIRKRSRTSFDLNDINEIVMRKINDLQSLIIMSDEKKVILKTPDRKQAEQWMEQLQKVFDEKYGPFDNLLDNNVMM